MSNDNLIQAAELLPCPFCGHSSPEFERLGTHRQSCIVACGMCGCKHESSDEGSRCGASWNTRAALAAAKQAVPAEQTLNHIYTADVDKSKRNALEEIHYLSGKIDGKIEAHYTEQMSAEQEGEQEPVEYQVLVLGKRWAHCSKEFYEAANGQSMVRALYTHRDRVKAEPLTEDALSNVRQALRHLQADECRWHEAMELLYKVVGKEYANPSKLAGKPIDVLEFAMTAAAHGIAQKEGE